MHYFPRLRMDLFWDILGLLAAQKVACSGFPRENMTDAEKWSYCEEIKRETGLDLRPADIVNSPSGIADAKTKLNSLM